MEDLTSIGINHNDCILALLSFYNNRDIISDDVCLDFDVVKSIIYVFAKFYNIRVVGISDGEEIGLLLADGRIVTKHSLM